MRNLYGLYHYYRRVTKLLATLDRSSRDAELPSDLCTKVDLVSHSTMQAHRPGGVCVGIASDGLVDKIQSPSRLSLMLKLTVCDVELVLAHLYVSSKECAWA